MGSEELTALLKRLLRRPGRQRPEVSLAPGCPFGAVMEQRVRDIEGQVAELRGRVNGLLFVIMGAVVVEIVLRFVR